MTDHVEKTCTKTENNGNGTTTETTYDCSYDTSHQELASHIPVWETKYRYDIDEWTYERDVNASGTDHIPFWPQYTLSENGAQVIGGERVSGNGETYTVTFVDQASKDNPPKSYSISVSQADWAQYQIEHVYDLKVNGYGNVTNNPLQDYLAAQATKTS